MKLPQLFNAAFGKPFIRLITNKMRTDYGTRLKCERRIQDYLRIRWEPYKEHSAAVRQFAIAAGFDEVNDRPILIEQLAQVIRARDGRIRDLEGYGYDAKVLSLIYADAVFPHTGTAPLNIPPCPS